MLDDVFVCEFFFPWIGVLCISDMVSAFQAITNTIQAGEGLPEQITSLEGLERIKNQDELVTE